MRNTRFSARFSRQDQTLLIHLAACMQRSKSDTVRILIYEKAAELGLLNTRYPLNNGRIEKGGK
jgi:hypothetical protein